MLIEFHASCRPFDDYLAALALNGTYGGNDSIVAFARLHEVCTEGKSKQAHYANGLVERLMSVVCQ
jgi:hypothetical protein